MLMEMPWSVVELEKHMQLRGDTKNSWIMFDRFKCNREWTKRHVICTILNIAMLLWLHVMTCNPKMGQHILCVAKCWALSWLRMMGNLELQGFIANNAQANWNVVRRYTCQMVTSLSLWRITTTRVHNIGLPMWGISLQIMSNHLWNFNLNKYAMITRMKPRGRPYNKYWHVIHTWWLPSQWFWLYA